MNTQAITGRHRGTLAQGKALIRLAVIACGVLCGGCEKWDTDEGLIEIRSEQMTGGHSKVRLDGASATWLDGDIIRINGENVDVVRQDGRAYISYATPQSVNRAVYPASLNSGSLGGDNITVAFPSYYHYRADNTGHQILELPMAARSADSEPLQFRHLTGALYVTVTNNATVSLTLQSVTVQSSRYQLSGSRSIDFSDLESIGSTAAGNADDRKVTLLFDTGYTLAANASLKVMLPVMPVGDDHNFTIQVRTSSAGQAAFYLNEQTQSSGSGHALERNQLGYAPIAADATTERIPLDQIDGNYVVRTPLEFSAMIKMIDAGNGNTSTYSILENIDMDGKSIFPISKSPLFAGTIDGNGHTVSNLKIKSKLMSTDYICALFEQTAASTRIQNITFDNLMMEHTGLITNKLIIGGLIASMENDSTLYLNNCTIHYGSVNIDSTAGSIYFGGLIGEVKKIEITNCHVTNSTTTMKGRSLWWGGLIASIGSSVNTVVTSSSWTGTTTIRATNNILLGGLIGNKARGTLTATGCEVTGRFEATSSGAKKFIGSLIGEYANPGTISTNNITTSAFTASLDGNELNDISFFGSNLAK